MIFRSTATAPPAERDDVVDPADLVPLSVLELDHPTPVTGWRIELERRGIEVLDDDVGRMAIARSDARALMWEHREAEAIRREAAERQREEAERRAIEADQRYRAQFTGGIPAGAIPAGMTAAELMMASDPVAGAPRRESVLEHALAHESGAIVYHPIGDES